MWHSTKHFQRQARHGCAVVGEKLTSMGVAIENVKEDINDAIIVKKMRHFLGKILTG